MQRENIYQERRKAGKQKKTIKTGMQYSDDKTIYIKDLTKRKHKKRRVKQLRVQFIVTRTYISTAEKQMKQAQL